MYYTNRSVKISLYKVIKVKYFMWYFEIYISNIKDNKNPEKLNKIWNRVDYFFFVHFPVESPKNFPF